MTKKKLIESTGEIYHDVQSHIVQEQVYLVLTTLDSVLLLKIYPAF